MPMYVSLYFHLDFLALLVEVLMTREMGKVVSQREEKNQRPR